MGPIFLQNCSLWLFVLVISFYATFYVVTFCPVTFCLTFRTCTIFWWAYSVGQSSLGDFSDKIHHRYKYTTQEGHFSPFPQSTSSNTEVVKVYTRKIESICYCGKPDVFQNMVGCEAKRGRVKCSKWVHQSCSGVSGDWFCDEHRDCWFCYMYWYFNCIIFKWMTCWCLEFLIFCFMYFYWTWVVFTCEIK